MRLRKAEGRENPEAAMAATRKAVRASWRAIAEQARDRAEADLRAIVRAPRWSLHPWSSMPRCRTGQAAPTVGSHRANRRRGSGRSP